MTCREWCEAYGYLEGEQARFIRLRRALKRPDDQQDDRCFFEQAMEGCCRWIAPERQEQLLSSPWLQEATT